MSTSMKIVIGALVFGVLIVLAIAGSYISAYNDGNRMENGITATWENNENILAQYGQKIQEAAQIPTMQRDDVEKIFNGALGARYGSDGSKAAMQWIHEQNPTLNTSVYVQLQRIIEAGRNEFQISQTKLVDQKNTYKNSLGSFWTGMWLRIAGYPKIDLNKYHVVSTDRVQDAFRTGKESAPIQLR